MVIFLKITKFAFPQLKLGFKSGPFLGFGFSWAGPLFDRDQARVQGFGAMAYAINFARWLQKNGERMVPFVCVIEKNFAFWSLS